jgi:PhzF family phenazine biosynthesis protein
MSSHIRLQYVTLDVFTKTRFEGNPLAVVKVPESCKLTQEQKQAIAREFNFSETTFLHECDAGEQTNRWTVDIFLTTAEIPFAGHPTIGTACLALSEAAQVAGGEGDVIHAEFQVKAGTIHLAYRVSENVTKAAIPHNLHLHNLIWSQDALLQTQPGLAEALRTQNASSKEQYPIVSIVKGMTFILIELENETLLNAVSTTSHALHVNGLDEGWNEASFVGAYFYVRLPDLEDGTKSLRTRMIEGALEDPATGSAASDLAGYLALQEEAHGATTKYAMTQGVEMGRRSDIRIEITTTGDGKIDSLYLIGSAVKVMEGWLTV